MTTRQFRLKAILELFLGILNKNYASENKDFDLKLNYEDIKLIVEIIFSAIKLNGE